MVYTGITVLVLSFINFIKKQPFLERWLDQEDRTAWSIGVGYVVLLFFFSFSYWGNHGMGDVARLPIGFGQAMYNIDGAWTYFSPNEEPNIVDINVEKFAVQQQQLSIQQEGGQYIVINLQTLEQISFPDKTTYNTFAAVNNLTNSRDFKDFSTHYKEYWSGWRFYLLP